MRITWIQTLKMLKTILSTWKSPINASHYFYNYFLIFMLIPLFLRWEIEAQKRVLTFSSHISQFSHTDTSPTRQADPFCISYSGSPITCTFNLWNSTIRKGEEWRGLERGKNAIQIMWVMPSKPTLSTCACAPSASGETATSCSLSFS